MDLLNSAVTGGDLVVSRSVILSCSLLCFCSVATVEPTSGTDSYLPRIVDDEVGELLAGLPALSLEGPKGVGKTSTARRHGASVVALDAASTLDIVAADPNRLTRGAEPIVIDEWQRHPSSWDVVRRAVDDDPRPGRFLLTGSATPAERPTHSGAGRIVPIRMRPLSFAERRVQEPTVSLARLLDGDRPPLAGRTSVDLDTYTDEILAGGLPGLRHPPGRIRRTALDGYVDQILDQDLPELGFSARNPPALRRWLRAYAAATSSTTSFEKIRAAATSGEGRTPARSTAIPYRDALERVWLLDPLPGWLPTDNHLRRTTVAPKHQLCDPALAARLLGLDAQDLLAGVGPSGDGRRRTFLGALFESLVTLSVRVYAQAAESRVHHLRTQGGHREVDLIVSRGTQRALGIAVKLAQAVGDEDVRHLRWLADRMGDDLLDAVVITTGPEAYRRADGIGVVPFALLGP